MREIKFRGYDLDSKSWVYGAYIKHIDSTPCLFTSKEEEEKWYKEHTKYLIAFDGFSDWWMPRGIDVCTSIAPDSIGQFTGLLDKNKKEIYEGDIIKYTLFNNSTLYEVKYNNSTLSWQLSNKYETKNISFAFKSRLEIIGNTYENPELLKINGLER